ncbi:ECF transporter S component, partial [Enterococcus faecalis]|uniref:ECF transporter S component n=1 Tax=Enterococcus faecalis TaxID=1351 RepID=UPI003D6A7054
VLLAFLAFLFGGVFMGPGFVYALLNAALLPLGLSTFANELLFGMWTMLSRIAAMLVSRARGAVLAEVLAALAEML